MGCSPQTALLRDSGISAEEETERVEEPEVMDESKEAVSSRNNKTD